MAEPSKYVSLRDLLESDPPKHRLTVSESTAYSSDGEDDDDVEDYSLRSIMLKDRINLSSSPPQPKSSDKVVRADPATTCKDDKGKDKIVEKGHTNEACSTRSARRFPSMRHSKSDDPLVYVGRGDDGDFDTFEDLKTASRRIINFSWEEINLNAASDDSDDNV